LAPLGNREDRTLAAQDGGDGQAEQARQPVDPPLGAARAAEVALDSVANKLGRKAMALVGRRISTGGSAGIIYEAQSGCSSAQLT
jgi:hypothetical protein